MNNSIRKVKLIYRNILAVKVYYYRFNILYYSTFLNLGLLDSLALSIYSEKKAFLQKKASSLFEIFSSLLDSPVYLCYNERRI
ncbi:hypothetical protein CVC39_00350 [Streptococcus pneumoniae]|nr:hypothetical protein [Streptococcus pneumoniae]MBS0669277.1 hypothetical protein [Streptococcus pneumoniae]MDA5261249.1 hypothetical protein [Streptococcus pneumoniae]MDA5275056.1 hypothetical protein [Streptococcus pneumoniae]OKQ06952.1 hypothetical protein BH638_07960 [Streptococcus pneumoniae]